MIKKILVMMCLFPVLLFGTTRYVRLDVTNPVSPFISWETAATNIQQAVDVCVSNDTVLVGDGIYAPTPKYLLNFGYYRFVVYSNILIESMNGPSKTVILGDGIYGLSSSTVRGAFLNQGTLSGFTFSNCVAFTYSAPTDFGYNSFGGVRIQRGTVTNCWFTRNSARYGGGAGVLVAGVSATFVDCRFENNYAEMAGGGLYLYGNAAGHTVRNSTFIGNECSLTTASSGGAIHSDQSQYKNTIMNCLIVSNKTALYGGGIYIYGGNNGLIGSCTIYQNVASNMGGGVYSASISATISNSIIHSNIARVGSNDFVRVGLRYCAGTNMPTGSGNVKLYGSPFAANTFVPSFSSPCINAGNNATALQPDLAGRERIVDGVMDIGCYERQPRVNQTSVGNFGSILVANGSEVLLTNYVTLSSGLEPFFIADHATNFSINNSSYIGIPLHGERIVHMTVANTGNDEYNAFTGSVGAIHTEPGQQTINFQPIPEVGYGSTNITLSASASSGLPVTFSCSDINIAEIEFTNQLKILRVGTAIISATQEGNDDYYATESNRVLVVNFGNQTITFPEFSRPYAIRESPIVLNMASSSSGLPITYVIIGNNYSIGSILGNEFSFWRSGQVNITARQLGNENYLAATSVTRTVTIYDGIFYVSQAGNNTNSGLSWASPVQTISRGLTIARAGDVVLVSNGLYNTELIQSPNGLLTNRVVITNDITLKSLNGPERTIISGNNSGLWTSLAGVRGVYMSLGILDGFTVCGGSTGSGTNPTNSAGGGVFAVSAIPKIRNCIITNNTAYYGGGVYRGSLENCVVAINRAYSSGGGCRESVLNSSTVTKNVLVNDDLGGGIYWSSLTNSICYGNVSKNFPHQNYVTNIANLFVSSCVFPAVNVNSNISVNPLFISANNFKLQYSSPAINAGNNDFTNLPTDIRGRTRVIENVIDMGAWEYQKLPIPTFNPSSRDFPDISGVDLEVVLTSSVAGAEIVYTTNGSYPIYGSSATYSSPLQIENTVWVTILARYQDEESPTNIAYYREKPWAPIPIIVMPSGIYSESILATITSPSPSGVSFYYTTNGTVPSPSNGLLYTTAGVTLSNSTLFKVAASKFDSYDSYDEKTYAFSQSVDLLAIDLRDNSYRFLSSRLNYNNDNTYKTNTILLKRIYTSPSLRGSPTNELGRDPRSENLVTNVLTEDYYIGVFEITQAQWQNIKGNNPSWFTNSPSKTRPVELVSYEDVRGTNTGKTWPASSQVDSDSFLGLLRSRVGIDVDLPTESQWEMACRAGTVTALNNGQNLTNVGFDANLSLLARYYQQGRNGIYNRTSSTGVGTADVGTYLPNAFGLYDMHGNVWEWCRDRYTNNIGISVVTNYVGDLSSDYRVLKGGAWGYFARQCRSGYRSAAPSHSRNAYDGMGFRLYAPSIISGITNNIDITVLNGQGSGFYTRGSLVEIQANLSPSNDIDYWETIPANIDLGRLYNSNSSPVKIIVPNTYMMFIPHLKTKSFEVSYRVETGEGLISGNINQQVLYGSNATSVSAIPSFGWVFKNWSDGKTTTNRTDLAITSNSVYSAVFTNNVVGLVISTNLFCIENVTTNISFTVTKQPTQGFFVAVTRLNPASILSNTTSTIVIDPQTWSVSKPYFFTLTARDNANDFTNEVASFILSTGYSNKTVTVREIDIDYPFIPVKYPASISNLAGEILMTPNKNIFRNNQVVQLRGATYNGYQFLGWATETNLSPVLNNPTNLITTSGRTNFYGFFSITNN